MSDIRNNIKQTGFVAERPIFPKRAIITGGMPYGNKDLHLGHIGGVFIHADIFARFLRDRIGKENVIFVSGTDCYGSPIVEYFRQMKEKNQFEGDLNEFVHQNHLNQKETLDAYHVDLNLFAASSFGRSAQIHQNLCADFFHTLYRNGHLEKLATVQYFDPDLKVFLNGRQVEGQCPIDGCQSEKAYADECSLGHQYDPADLINPQSTLSGKTPEKRTIENWYLKLPAFGDALVEWVNDLEKNTACRLFALSSIREFFEKPAIFVKKDQVEFLDTLKSSLPPYTLEETKSDSVKLVFQNLDDRESARAQFAENNIRYRTGKTLVPFRLTGNIDWGLPAPTVEGLDNLTFWVWPESLIAPISFSETYLESMGKPGDEWKKWWCSKDVRVYQFIGEDNVYFYGPAQTAIFYGTQGSQYRIDPPEGDLQVTNLIVNHHVLFLDKKASSSGKIKPPMAKDLLDYYTAEQLRTHFFSLGLGNQSVGFKPKPLNPKAHEKDADPVLKEGNLLCNVFNRAVRSCFYTVQKYFDGKLPAGSIDGEIIDEADRTILRFERAMYQNEFHAAMAVLDAYIRSITKYWAAHTGKQALGEANEGLKQTLINTFHMVKTAAVLLHPIAPKGTEMVLEYLNIGEELFNWDRVFDTLNDFIISPQEHTFKFLEPRVDFFKQHPFHFKSS
ncbi:MAG: class I tRNA ligase family protein [Deltaproteobacteria bacterium]|nr:class I tRNA ligase family protein [Deltaproteobacteria bacterium]